MQWVLGAERYVYTTVSSAGGEAFTISTATYEVFDASDESVVASGAATVQDATIFFLWEPVEVGVFVARFNYFIGSEDFYSSQVIEVKETM